jgi:hypothetical protein
VLKAGTGTLSGGTYGTVLMNNTWFGGIPDGSVVPGALGELGHDWLIDGPASGTPIWGSPLTGMTRRAALESAHAAMPKK